MKDLVQKMMVYMIIVSAMRGLLMNKKYEEYFRFFSGMMMILMLFTPIFHIFGGSSQWYQKLEANFLDMDIKEIEGTLQVADGGLEKMVWKEYEEELEKKVTLFAKENGITIQKAEVSLEKGIDGIVVSEIQISHPMDEMIQGKQEESEEIAVAAIQINKEKKQKEEDTSHEMQTFKKKLCKKFALPEKKIHIWK